MACLSMMHGFSMNCADCLAWPTVARTATVSRLIQPARCSSAVASGQVVDDNVTDHRPVTVAQFRHHSWTSPVARGIIIGLGAHGYPLAMRALHRVSEAG
jgi:Dehydroquinase class II